ncbi:MAG: hypothetical protein AAGH79_11205 [Bacteroidota bacterium]
MNAPLSAPNVGNFERFHEVYFENSSGEEFWSISMPIAEWLVRLSGSKWAGQQGLISVIQ